MSRLYGFAAAGLQILEKTKPAFVTQYGQVPSLLMAGPFALVVMLCSLVGTHGSFPVMRTQSPDTALLSVFKEAVYTPANDNRSFSPFSGGTQMDIYKDIFRYLDMGDIAKADSLIPTLQDKDLLGHVLAQKLLSPSYKASFADLKNWMEHYADHPQAVRMARLANARAPKGQATFKVKNNTVQPIEAVDEQALIAKIYRPTIKRTGSQEAMAKNLMRAIRHHVQIYEPSIALRLFNESEATLYLDDVEKSRIRAIIASGYLYAGKVDEAAAMAEQAIKASGDKAPMAGWIHGLAAWQMKNYKGAAGSFEMAAASPYFSGWMAAGAAYWAARSYDKIGNSHKKAQWMERAAAYPRTFYGLLAIAAIQGDASMRWNTPRLTFAQEREILSTPAGARAQKLLSAGQTSLAEAELKSLYKRGDAARKQALLSFAYDRNLPSLSMKLAHSILAKSDDTVEAALYPSMPWTPQRGYRIDRALIHAIARQESRFNPSAQNKGSGATGLMQLMPRTAYHVARDEKYLNENGREELKNPEVSLGLGQKYVEELLNNALVGQDLLSLAMAYNAGPGTLSKWKSERAGMNDPLLFIETIPFHETRNYVERVMSNYWMYRMRFDQSNDSMVALAGGKWARYASQDAGSAKFADASR